MDKLLVISSYPPRGEIHNSRTVGIASYAKNTLLGIKNASVQTEITVLAEKFNGVKESYLDQGINVKRVWSRNSFFIFPTLLWEILTNHKNSKRILFELELSMFGGSLTLLPIPIFNILLRIMGKKTIFVVHQVVPNINEMSGHINVGTNSLKSKIINFGISIFYRFLLLSSSKVIVFDQILKEKLAKFGDENKISVIAHGVQEFKKLPTKEVSREKLGLNKDDFVILYFGYIAWYKGTDWLLNVYRNLQKTHKNKKIRLIIAGGPNPNHLDKSFYLDYVSEIEKQSKDVDAIYSGFVKEETIPYYFQASDLVVLPYRTLMSASGPLSIALSFKKPFIVSEKLRGIFKTQDMKEVLGKEGISENNLIFGNEDDFAKVVLGIQSSQDLNKDLIAISSSLNDKRSWGKIGKQYYNEIS